MRFMILIKATKDTEAGVLPDQKLLAEMGKFNEELVKAGVMLAGEGLQPSSKGARIKFSGKKRSVIDGPFAETKELICGFWIWQVNSKEEAIEWVKRCPNPHNEDTEASRARRRHRRVADPTRRTGHVGRSIPPTAARHLTPTRRTVSAMGERDDRRDEVEPPGNRNVADNLTLRDISTRLLSEIDAIRELEREARKVAMGTPEFRQLSAEIAARSRNVFHLANEQAEVAQELPPQDETIEDLEKRDLP